MTTVWSEIMSSEPSQKGRGQLVSGRSKLEPVERSAAVPLAPSPAEMEENIMGRRGEYEWRAGVGEI